MGEISLLPLRTAMGVVSTFPFPTASLIVLIFAPSKVAPIISKLASSSAVSMATVASPGRDLSLETSCSCPAAAVELDAAFALVFPFLTTFFPEAFLVSTFEGTSPPPGASPVSVHSPSAELEAFRALTEHQQLPTRL